MKAILVSDIYGAKGRSNDYMNKWVNMLSLRNYDVQSIYLDELYPPAYIVDTSFCKTRVHEKFITNGISEAVDCLRQILITRPVDLLVGFSLGGLLVALARKYVNSNVKIICISATRLRFYQNLEGEASVHAVFGEHDPFRPMHKRLLREKYYEHIVMKGTHEIYLDVDLCKFVLDQVLL